MSSRLPICFQDRLKTENGHKEFREHLESVTVVKLLPNTVIRDRYLILKELGEGGFGSVYQAEDRLLNRVVAVKVLKEISESDFKRFQRESKLLAKLSHPNVVSVYSIEMLDELCPMIVMEYLEGQSLKSLINQSTGGLDAKTCRSVLIQTCAGLASAHDEGIVHRDLSPANIFILNRSSNDLQVKIIDFGLSKSLNPVSSASNSPGSTKTLTKAGSLIGNPSYMSPEASKGEVVDCASDIYSLGCIFYEMLTGSQPFEATEPIGILYKQLSEYPKEPLLNWGNGQEAEIFKNIALFCLQKEKDRRPSSASVVQKLVENSVDVSKYLMGAGTWQCDSSNAKSPVNGNKVKLFSALALLALLLLCLALVKKNSPADGSAKSVQLQAGQLNELKRLKEKVAQKQARYGANSLMAINAQNDLAEYYYEHESYQDAIEILKNLVLLPPRLIKEKEQLEDERMLVNSYLRTNQLDLAELWANRAFKSVSVRIDKDTETYRYWLQKLAFVYVSEMKWTDAEKYSFLALHSAEKLYGKDSLFYMTAQLSVAECYSAQRKTKLAIQMLEPASKTAEMLIQEDDLNLHQSADFSNCMLVMRMLGLEYCNNHDFAKGNAYLKKCIDFGNSYKCCSPWLPSFKSSLAMSLESQNRLPEAIKFYREAYEDAENLGLQLRSSRSYYLLSLANCLRRNKDYAEAFRAYKKAVDYAENERNRDPLGWFSCQKELAFCYICTGQHAEAAKIYKFIIPQFKGDADSWMLAESYERLAECFGAEQKWDQAQKNLELAKAIAEKDEHSHTMAYVLSGLGKICHEHHEEKKAAEYFEHAFNLGIALQDPLCVSIVGMEYANFMEANKDYEKSAEILRKALKFFSDEHSSKEYGLDVRKKLETVLEKLGKNDEDQKYRLKEKNWNLPTRK